MSNKKFNPLADFVAGRGIVVDGKQISAGEPFDKSLVGPRRLRQMWEARRVVYAPEREQIAPKPALKVEKLPSGNKQEAIVSVEAPQATMTHDGGPWYTVTFADGTTEKVKGKKKAEALING